MSHRLFQLIAALVIAVTPDTHAQDAKLHLRDFTPKYRTDTFQLNGEPTIIKRKVINALQIKGIKSAFWQEDLHLLTVQYDSKLISIDKIKTLFTHPQGNTQKVSIAEQNIPIRKSPFRNYKPFNERPKGVISWKVNTLRSATSSYY